MNKGLPLVSTLSALFFFSPFVNGQGSYPKSDTSMMENLQQPPSKQQAGDQFSVSFIYFLSTSEEFDHPYGAEMRYEKRVSDYFAVGFSAGYELWDLKLKDKKADIKSLPIGVSLTLIALDKEPISLALDLGAYYSFLSGDLDLDNPIFGRAAAMADIHLSETAGFFATAGYQFDIIEAKQDAPLDDLSMAGSYLSAGFRFNF